MYYLQVVLQGNAEGKGRVQINITKHWLSALCRIELVFGPWCTAIHKYLLAGGWKGSVILDYQVVPTINRIGKNAFLIMPHTAL